MATPTRPLEDFFPLVRPFASMVSDGFAEQNLRLAAIQFCERTRAWRSNVIRTITRNEAVVVCPSYATIFEIENASFDGNPLCATQYTDLDINQGNEIPTGSPIYITQSTPGSVIIFPFNSGKLSINVFLKPKSAVEMQVGGEYDIAGNDEYNVVPEFLLVQHGEAIAKGALSRLLVMRNQPWTDLEMAAVYRADFEKACDNHFNHQIRGEQRARARSRPSFY